VGTLHWIDGGIVLVFALYAVFAGLRSRRIASRDLDEYFLAGRSLPGWKAGLSMAATQFAADTPLLVTGLIATAGIFALWQIWIYAIAFLMMGFVLAPSWRRAQVLTDAELTELRYGSSAAVWLRGIKAIYFGTIFNCVVLAWVLFATKAIAEPFLLWDQWLPQPLFDSARILVERVGVPLAVDPADPALWIQSTNNLISIAALVSVTLFYSATGGLRSVVETDVVQIVIMLAATAVYAGYIVAHLGGFEAAAQALRTQLAAGGPGGISASQVTAFTPSRAKDASPALLALFAVQWFIQLNADGTGYLAQRSMACRSDREAKTAAVVFTFTQVLVRSLLWLPIGLGLLVLFPPDLSLPLETLRHEREVTFVRGIAELLPVGVRGLMLTAMLAALASTIDTHLNWGASYWTNDIYKRLVCEAWLDREPSPRALVWVARCANLLILVLALAVMTQLSSIEQAWRAALLLGAGMGPMLVLRWVWWRVSAGGELACVVASLVAALPLLDWVHDGALRLLTMAALSTAAGLAGSLAWPEKPARLRAFFEKVRPPGWWGPIATAAGADDDGALRRLARGSAATAAASLSCFSLLVGFGTWVAGSPTPTWWPQSPGSWAMWIAANLALGSALIPL